MDGAGAASEQKPQENNPDPHVKRRTRYRVRKDVSGELMKDVSGNYVFALLYNEELQEIASFTRQAGRN